MGLLFYLGTPSWCICARSSADFELRRFFNYKSCSKQCNGLEFFLVSLQKILGKEIIPHVSHILFLCRKKTCHLTTTTTEWYALSCQHIVMEMYWWHSISIKRDAAKICFAKANNSNNLLKKWSVTTVCLCTASSLTFYVHSERSLAVRQDVSCNILKTRELDSWTNSKTTCHVCCQWKGNVCSLVKLVDTIFWFCIAV